MLKIQHIPKFFIPLLMYYIPSLMPLIAIFVSFFSSPVLQPKVLSNSHSAASMPTNLVAICYKRQ